MLLAFLIGVTAGQSLAARRFIEVTRSTVNIRAQPGTRGQLVAKAYRGDIFELTGEEEGWFRIRLFSGKSRYIHKNLARPASYQLQVPADADLRRRVYREWFKAEERAEKEAGRKYPPNFRLKENLEYQQILNDRYKLRMMQKLGVQAPVYRRIILEGNQKHWMDQ